MNFIITISLCLISFTASVQLVDIESESKLQSLQNLFLPLLFPKDFKEENQIQNGVLSQIKPFLDPATNALQTALNPTLSQINENANKIPVFSNILKDCTENVILCILTNLDNALEDGPNK